MNRLHRFDVLVLWYNDYLKINGYQNRTRGDYLFELRYFRRFLEQKTKVRDLDDINADILHRYIAALYDKGLVPGTIHHKIAALINFFGALYTESKHFVDLREYLTLPRIGKKLPSTILTTEEINRVFSALELMTDGLTVETLTDAIALRDHAVLELFYSTGIRRNEIMELRLDDLNAHDALLRVQGKGGVQRMVPVGAHCLTAVGRYIHEARKIFVLPGSPDYLFLTRRGGQMGYQTVKSSVDRVMKFAGIERRVKVHSLRHTCATHMLDKGADIRYVQEQLGHKCLSSTQVYTHVSIKKLQETHRKYHPREQEEDNDGESKGGTEFH